MRRAGLRALKAYWIATRAAAVVSRRAAGWFAWRLWFTPWRVPESERTRTREAAWLAAATPLRVPFRSGVLHGFTAGDGPGVMLVHGWGDRASRLGAFVEPLTAAGFRVVAIDLPAHGDSPGLRTDAYEIAAALRATADHVGGVYAVVAHSMGGMEALFALRHGLTAERVVLLAPAVRLEHSMDRFSQLFRLPQRAVEGLRRRIGRRFGATVWTDLASDLTAPGLRIPALIVHDTEDEQVAFADGERLERVWPSARLVRTTGLGHDRILRDSRVVEAAVSFLQATAADEAPPAAIPARVR